MVTEWLWFPHWALLMHTADIHPNITTLLDFSYSVSSAVLSPTPLFSLILSSMGGLQLFLPVGQLRHVSVAWFAILWTWTNFAAQKHCLHTSFPDTRAMSDLWCRLEFCFGRRYGGEKCESYDCCRRFRLHFQFGWILRGPALFVPRRPAIHRTNGWHLPSFQTLVQEDSLAEYQEWRRHGISRFCNSQNWVAISHLMSLKSSRFSLI